MALEGHFLINRIACNIYAYLCPGRDFNIWDDLGLKNRCVSANMPQKIRVGRSENLFIFLKKYLIKLGLKCFPGLHFTKTDW